MKFSDSFAYQLDDPEWPRKLGLGALISMVPILNLVVAGYMVQVTRNVAAGMQRPLPEWDDASGKFHDGFILAIVGIVYALPILIAAFFALAALDRSGALASDGGLQDLGHAIGGPGILALVCLVGMLVLYSGLLGLVRPAIMVLFSRDGTFASCFRLGEFWRMITVAPASYFLTLLAIFLSNVAMGLVLGFLNLVFGWIPCLGWAAGLLLGLGSAMYLLTVEAHLYGQLRQEVPSMRVSPSQRPAG